MDAERSFLDNWDDFVERIVKEKPRGRVHCLDFKNMQFLLVTMISRSFSDPIVIGFCSKSIGSTGKCSPMIQLLKTNHKQRIK